MALDAQTRQVVAFLVGDRSRESAQELWAKIPVAYREPARLHPAPDKAYKGVMPAEQHQAMTKQARKTSHLARFNHTLRPRLARLGRETWSFSTKLANHIGARREFIGRYHLTRAAALPI